MKTISLKIPDSLDIDSVQLSIMLASYLYEQGKLSLGQAAEVAGLSKKTFSELLGQQEVSLFNYPASDLKNDVANA